MPHAAALPTAAATAVANGGGPKDTGRTCWDTDTRTGREMKSRETRNLEKVDRDTGMVALQHWRINPAQYA